ncbi:MAG: PTS sugar transporter subunit IIA, partial [Atopostipes suicloacalis]|nr:PTS sugar transporter subunit IIA [Atopostipes suicloacalis]
HIGITIERMLNGNYLSSDHLDKKIVDTIEYTISQEFFKRILKKIPLNYDEEEIIALAKILRGYKDSGLLQETVDFNGETKNIHFLLDKIIINIQEMFDLDFSKDKDFINGLHLHIQTLINRIKNESSIPNVHLQEIKLSYPLIFEMGIHVGQLITDYFGFEISESETGFIALHIGAAYDRLSKKYKHQVLLIAPQNESLLKLTKGKIRNMFKDRMEIVAVTQYLVEKEVENSNIDLIISVLPIQHSLAIKTVEISMFVDHENEGKIFRALNELDKQRFTMEFGNQFGTLIDERFYFIDLDFQTPKEVIEHMADKLEKENVVSPHFKESVLEREAIASTSFVYSLAIPHPLILNSEQSKIAIGILKKPIKWGTYNVKLIMMPAIKEEDSSKMWLFFDWLSETITNAEKMTKLIESKNKNEFVHWMIND